MVDIPADELGVIKPYRGGSILEFGNKGNRTGQYREWYEAEGCKNYVCIDWNGKDGALPMDCNEPFLISPRNFSMVTNFGFSEHVQNQPMFWENHHNHVGQTGLMVGVTPAPLLGHWDHHGILQPTRGFYHALAVVNDYQVSALFINENRKRHTVCYRMVKVHDRPFVMPPHWEDMIIKTPDPSAQAHANSRI